MKLKSDTISKVLTILLWVLVASAALDFAETLVYLAAPDFFSDQLLSSYGFVNVLAAVLYYVVVVIYLIWIHRVHMDLNHRFPFYGRSPGQALACIMIPFYNIVGTPSVYLSIGRQFQSASPRLHKRGRWIGGLAVPLLLAIYANNILVQAINRADDPSDTLILVSSIVTLLLYGVFLFLCIAVSQGVKQAFASWETNDAPAPSDAEAETEAAPAGLLS